MAKAKAKTTKAAPRGGSSLASRLGAKPTTKAKSSTPQVTVTDEAHLTLMAAIVDAKGDVKRAESALDVAEGALRDDAIEMFEDKCRKDAELHTSVHMLGILVQEGEDNRPVSLSLTQNRRCGKMTEADASDPLHSAFGVDYESSFDEQRVIEIKTGNLSDDQIDTLVEKMQEALGDDFDAAVALQALIVPKPEFYRKRMLDTDFRVKVDHAAADGYAKVTKAFFKLK